MHKITMIIGGTIPDRYRDSFPDITLHDSTTLNQAVEIAVRLEREREVDAIISPSGTAAELEKHVSIPIIRADPSRFDILETLHYAEEQSGLRDDRIALVLHHSRSIDVQSFQPFVRNKICYFTYETERDIAEQVGQLSRMGIRLLVGGPTTIHFARRHGIDGFILRLSVASLRLSVREAQGILQFAQKSREQSRRLDTALNLFLDGVLITNNTGAVIECNNKAADIFKLTRDQLLGRSIEQLTNDATCQEVYHRGVQQLDRIIELPGVNLFSNRMPVVTDGKVQGAVITLQEAAKIEKLEHKYRQYQSRGLTAKYHFKDIIGQSGAMKTAVEKAKAFAMFDSTILIWGETGSGKEMFAQSIHNHGHRAKGPFVAINCAALPEQLLESELMGYEEGAFTSAKRGGKAGLFELAHMGTIFLDEINQIPIQLQANILRVLQERQVLRLGGERMIPINVRIVAATNEDLVELIRKGRFREDLYYRLNVLNLTIPPLRAHREDIAPLIGYYFNLFTRQYGPTPPFTPEALRLLENHAWAGNIRELINCVERYVVISRHLVSSDMEFVGEYLRSEQRSAAAPGAASDPNLIQVMLGTLSDMERQLISAVLERYGGNKLQSAMALGISRTTLWKKLQEASDAV